MVDSSASSEVAAGDLMVDHDLSCDDDKIDSVNDSVSEVSDANVLDIDDEPPVSAYKELLAAQEKEDRALIDDATEEEREELVAGGQCDEVLQDASFTKERLLEMRSPYVMDGSGQKHHKKSLLKAINKGKSLVKSFDRLERVKGTARRGGNSGGGQVESVVTRAFGFKYPHDPGNDPDAGGERHNADDYCCVMVDSDKVAQMVIGKFQRFGGETSATPLELYWPINKGDFRASVVIIRVVEYNDVSNAQCLRSTGEIVGTLRNVHSSCIVPINPELEDSASSTIGMVVTNAVMKVSELSTVFSGLSLRKKHLRAKNDIKIHPILVGVSKPFVVAVPTNSFELPVCNICVPPKIIGKKNMKGYDIQRALRNHNALHQLQAPPATKDELCGLCSGSNCDLDVDITGANKRNILKGEAKVLPDSVVFHSCKTFESIEPFQYKYVKVKAGYPSTNIPVLCHDCPTQNFIWSYSIEMHYDICHAGLDEDDRKKYKGLLVDKDEQRVAIEAAAVKMEYGINVDETSTK